MARFRHWLRTEGCRRVGRRRAWTARFRKRRVSPVVGRCLAPSSRKPPVTVESSWGRDEIAFALDRARSSVAPVVVRGIERHCDHGRGRADGSGCRKHLRRRPRGRRWRDAGRRDGWRSRRGHRRCSRSRRGRLGRVVPHGPRSRRRGGRHGPRARRSGPRRRRLRRRSDALRRDVRGSTERFRALRRVRNALLSGSRLFARRVPERRGTGLSVCGSDPTCRGGACRDLRTDYANCGACGHACCAGTVCSGGRCFFSCPAGLTTCGEACEGGGCFDLGSNPTHCGACGNACVAGTRCVVGTCTPTTLDAGGGDVGDG